MTAKLTRPTHKITTQLQLMAESCTFAFLAPGSQGGNFWIHPCTYIAPYCWIVKWAEVRTFQGVCGWKMLRFVVNCQW